MKKYKVIKEFFAFDSGYKFTVGEDYEFHENCGVCDTLLKENYIEEVEARMIKKWEDLEKISGFFVRGDSNIELLSVDYKTTRDNRNIFATENQARSALAMAQLSQLMAHESVNGDWKPDWTDGGETKFIIFYCRNNIGTKNGYYEARFLAFKTEEIRDEFLELHRELIEEYFKMYK